MTETSSHLHTLPGCEGGGHVSTGRLAHPTGRTSKRSSPARPGATARAKAACAADAPSFVARGLRQAVGCGEVGDQASARKMFRNSPARNIPPFRHLPVSIPGGMITRHLARFATRSCFGLQRFRAVVWKGLSECEIPYFFISGW